MGSGIVALICGGIAIIPGSLCLIGGAGGFIWFILSLLTLIFCFPAIFFGNRALKNKGEPGYVPGLVGAIMGFIAFFEVIASGILYYI